MIIIRLSTGEEATVKDGVWKVTDNPELSRVLNAPSMQPPDDGTYAPTQDARMATFVLQAWGGTWVFSDEHYPPGLVY